VREGAASSSCRRSRALYAARSSCPPLVAALRAHRAEQLAERLHAGSEWHDGAHGGHVFAQLDGKPIDPHRDWSEWKALLRLAGVRDARLLDARHTAATLLLT
jgi:integrase